MSLLKDKKKRVRAANFTADEVRLLIRLALKEKHILENKQTDSEVWKLKTKTWEKIAEVFNASSGQTFRSVETLRLKYDGLKKDLKKKVTKNKAETMKTGGGNPDYIVIDGPEKELLEVLSLSVNGLTSVFDSDRVLPQTTVTGEPQSVQTLVQTVQILEDVPVITEEEIESYVHPLEIDVHVICPGENPAESSISPLISPESQQEQPDSIEEEKPKKNTNGSNGTWKNWSPGALKSKKHPLLTPKKMKGEDRNKKVDNLLALREELVRKQIKQIDEEERRAQEKHEKEMRLLDLEILQKEKNL